MTLDISSNNKRRTIILEQNDNDNNSKNKKSYWQNELESLGIKPKPKREEVNDKEELEALSDIIKQVYFQDYKTAYDSSNVRDNNKTLIDPSHFLTM